MAFRKKAKKVPETFRLEETGGIMGGAEEMRDLAQEIASSFDARVAGVAARRQETAAKLKEFRQEMKNVQHELRRKAADLKQFLGNARSSRLRDFRTMHQDIRAGQEARNQQVSGMLARFRQEREAAVSHWQHMAGAIAKKRASLAR